MNLLLRARVIFLSFFNWNYSDTAEEKHLIMLTKLAYFYLQIFQLLESQKRIRCQVSKWSSFQNPIQN